MTQKNELSKLRLSAALVLSMAVSRLYGDVQLGTCGLTEDGFYYDFHFPSQPLSEYDLSQIEEEMQQIIEKALPIKHVYKTHQESMDFYSSLNQPFKMEVLEESKAQKIGFYVVGENGFVDIVKGSLLKSTREVGAVKLLSVAGAYWQGNENRPMLTRIYGTNFATAEELELFLAYKEELQRRDHRVIGKKLDYYIADIDIGSGVFAWQPRGAYVKEKLKQFISSIYAENGFMPLTSPQLISKRLLEESGFAEGYSDLYPEVELSEDEHYIPKPPFNPVHLILFGTTTRSYRDLPWRVSEISDVCKNERSGELQGLLRAREFTQDECHTVCSRENLESELESQLNLMLFILRSFGLNDLEIVLHNVIPQSVEGKGYEAEWDLATTLLRTVVKKAGYFLKEGEHASAFQGPKIEILFRDSLKRSRTISVLQVDLVTPRKLHIEYVAKDGLQHTPYVLHRTVLGSFERFIAILLEHYAGNLPLWLQLEKCRILPVVSSNEYYAESLLRQLREQEIFATIDYANEPIEGKIKQAEEEKIPYIIVVGDKEQRNNGVSVRVQGLGDIGLLSFEQFSAAIREEINSKSVKSLLV